MKYHLLESLLPHLEAYERAYPQQQNPQHFAVWLARQTADEQHLADRNNPAPDHETTDVAITKLLMFLHRYARGYAKKALEGSLLGTMDEFTYLGILLHDGPMTKSELIQRNRHEKPTGMEIIRRLLEMNLVAQSDDLNDRRSKQLRATPEGAAIAAQVSEGMGKAAQLLTGNLNPAEKMLLLQLLERLEQFNQVVQAKMKTG